MLQLVRAFLSQGWKVLFGTAAKRTSNAVALSKLGVTEVSLTLNDASFDRVILEINPTVVLFDRFFIEEQFGWRVAEKCPKALRILDTEDLHCLRKTRHVAIKKRIPFTNEMLLNSDISKREIAAIYRSDLSLITSTFEMKLLTDVFKVDVRLLYHLPFLLDKIGKHSQLWKPFKEREHFISIGNFLHPPNLDAILVLKTQIWNRIRNKIPFAEIHLYGAYPTQQVFEYTNSKEGFYVHGFIDDARAVIGNSKVLLAPLRFGAGIKGKLTDAMTVGTPSVTTTIGAEGMCDHLTWNGFIEDDMATFVEKAVRLYTDEQLWNQKQQQGIKIVNRLYNKQGLKGKFLEKIAHLLDNLNTHRDHNFVGKMLTHHVHKSSKYMSKWIEEKNK